MTQAEIVFHNTLSGKKGDICSIQPGAHFHLRLRTHGLQLCTHW